MEFSQFNVNALMEITARPDLVFVRGRILAGGSRGQAIPGLRPGLAVNTLGHSAPEMQKALLDQSSC